MTIQKKFFLENEINQDIVEKIDSTASQILSCFDLPGMAIGIVKGKDIIYASSFGYKNILTKEPVALDTLFCTRSISKVFVATAIMQLAEQGKVNIEKPITEYLEYFKLADERYKKITIKNLLNHTSGITNIDNKFKGEIDDGALERYVRSLSTEVLAVAPGERFFYSDTGYSILGDVISKISGMAFEEYINIRILKPLEMNSSSFLKKDILKEKLATPHIRKLCKNISDDDLYYDRALAPSDSLYSNIPDMCNWISANIHFGEYNKTRILNDSSYDLLYNKSIEFFPISLGWYVTNYRKNKVVSHTGGAPGFGSLLGIIPEMSIGIVVLSNTMSFPKRELFESIVDILINIEPDIPKAPISYKLASLIVEKGIDEAINIYYESKKNLTNKFVFEYNDLKNLGQDLMKSKMFKEAIEVFTLNTKEFPDNSDAFYTLGNVYLEKGSLELAIKNANLALALDPDNFEVKVLLEKTQSY